MAWFWTIIQLLIRLLASFWIYGGKISLGFWFEIEGLNQRISYWKLRKIISRVYQVIKNRFLGWLYGLFSNKYPATYSFIRLFFGVTVSKRCIEFDTKLKDWIKRYLIETWHRLFHGCFKSYRIAFRVALWLDFEQLSSYLFISRCLFRAAISKCYMEFDTKLKDWINRYLIQTYHRLSQEYFKSYEITFRVALWLVFK